MKYFPFTGEAYIPKVGIKPLDLAAWMERDENFDKEIALKKKVLQDSRDLVYAETPGTEEACGEVEQLIRENLLQHHSLHYSQKYFDSFKGERPLERASLYVQEDLCLMSPDSPTRLVAGSVCFPSRWNLREKLGKDMMGIHAPVPNYKDSVAKPVDKLMEMLPVERPGWRMNFTFHDSMELHCPHMHTEVKTYDVDTVLDRVTLRIERQTLRRLPVSKYVLFTIRTYIHPMQDVIADHERLLALYSTARQLPLEVAYYKGMRQFHQPLLQALEKRVASITPV